MTRNRKSSIGGALHRSPPDDPNSLLEPLLRESLKHRCRLVQTPRVSARQRAKDERLEQVRAVRAALKVMLRSDE